MRYFWIRPLCRLLGLLFLAIGATGAVSSACYIYQFTTNMSPGTSSFLYVAVDWVVRPLSYLSLGAWLFWWSPVVERLVSRGLYPPGFCQRCGYNKAGAEVERCPECGHSDQPAG